MVSIQFGVAENRPNFYQQQQQQFSPTTATPHKFIFPQDPESEIGHFIRNYFCLNWEYFIDSANLQN
jgi:hypothetical protein